MYRTKTEFCLVLFLCLRPGLSLSIAEINELEIEAELQVPYLNLHANSEQKNPVYLGVTPYEVLSLKKELSDSLILPLHLKAEANRAFGFLKEEFRLPTEGYLEIWPTLTEEGRLQWSFVRWRSAGGRKWAWFYADPDPTRNFQLPVAYDLKKKSHRRKVFMDFADSDDLYFKPVFSECIFVDRKDFSVQAAWLSPGEREDASKRFSKGEICLKQPMPSRFNLRAKVFRIAFKDKNLLWPEGIVFKSPTRQTRQPNAAPVNKYYEIEEKKLRSYTESIVNKFKKRNSFEKDSDLLALTEFLKEKYQSFGLSVRILAFNWLGIGQANLLACSDANVREPVVFADHLDSAFAENHFRKTGERISVPGADDNALATAALLSLAETLANIPNSRTKNFCFLHLTGEEYPADDLGARHFAKELLANGQKVKVIVVLDMIGYVKDRKQKNPIFQINSGKTQTSFDWAIAVNKTAKRMGLPLTPVLRDVNDPKSYLFNTDAYIFSELGMPTLLINEHINLLENFARLHYHELSDTTDTIHWPYAKAILEAVLNTALILEAF